MRTKATPQAILPTHRVLSDCLVIDEPTLEELLSEPIVMLRIRRTGLPVQEVHALCQRVRDRLMESRTDAGLPGKDHST